MSRLVVAPSARNDLDQIWNYIAIENDAPTSASRLLDRFHDAFSRLSRNTGIGTACDWLQPGLRRFPVWPYIVFYSRIADGVEILRVIHGARNIEALFGVEEH